MQRISALKSGFGQRLLMLSLICLIALSGLFIFVAPASYAAPISTEGQKLIQQEKRDQASQIADQRSQEYEQQVEASKDIDKIYEENVKAFEKSQPQENIVEKAAAGAEKLVEKVTGKD